MASFACVRPTHSTYVSSECTTRRGTHAPRTGQTTPDDNRTQANERTNERTNERMVASEAAANSAAAVFGVTAGGFRALRCATTLRYYAALCVCVCEGAERGEARAYYRIIAWYLSTCDVTLYPRVRRRCKPRSRSCRTCVSILFACLLACLFACLRACTAQHRAKLPRAKPRAKRQCTVVRSAA